MLSDYNKNEKESERMCVSVCRKSVDVDVRSDTFLPEKCNVGCVGVYRESRTGINERTVKWVAGTRLSSRISEFMAKIANGTHTQDPTSTVGRGEGGRAEFMTRPEYLKVLRRKAHARHSEVTHVFEDLRKKS